MASDKATHRLHIPLTNAPECGHRSRDSHRICRRAKGHAGRHAWFWRHVDPGRVLEVWEADCQVCGQPTNDGAVCRECGA